MYFRVDMIYQVVLFLLVSCVKDEATQPSARQLLPTVACGSPRYSILAI